MRRIDYDTMYNETTGSTETHLAVDTKMQMVESDPLSYAEGFASASGVRNETAESGGRIRHPETQDASHPSGAVSSVQEENAGLADG